MPAPITIAAIDAGSNALRLLVSRTDSPNEFEPIETERVAVRLGHQVFTKHELSDQTIDQAVEAFHHFSDLLHRHYVEKYRAVGTAALRSAKNRNQLLDRIRTESGIDLEVIDGAEEARLVRLAVLEAMGPSADPRLIFDLGGGSLELNFLKARQPESAVTMPIGTVRLMETLDVKGAMSDKQVASIRDSVLGTLKKSVPKRSDLSWAASVACGGNAEALAKLAPGDPWEETSMPTIDVDALRAREREITGRTIVERMKLFGVRKDRAEVMGIASIVVTTLGEWLGAKKFVVPGVGVREGIVRDLARKYFEPEVEAAPALAVAVAKKPVARDERTLQESLRRFHGRFAEDVAHGEQVRRLAAALFGQLHDALDLSISWRPVLEGAALLHDVGHAINRKGHQEHGAYMVKHANIAGMQNDQREAMSWLVGHHSVQRSATQPPSKGKNDSASHDALSVLATRLRLGDAVADRPHPIGIDWKTLLGLLALLRLADGLDSDHRQSVDSVRASLQSGKELTLVLSAARSTELRRPMRSARRRSGLFETLYGASVTTKDAKAL